MYNDRIILSNYYKITFFLDRFYIPTSAFVWHYSHAYISIVNVELGYFHIPVLKYFQFITTYYQSESIITVTEHGTAGALNNENMH